jgi:hypothetical protein
VLRQRDRELDGIEDAKMADSMLHVAILTTTGQQRSHLMIHSDCGRHCCWPEVDIDL